MSLIEDALLAARIERPYYQRAIAALIPVDVSSIGMSLDTVAVDKDWRLYYCPEWIESVGAIAAGRVIATHEVEHLLRAHARRLAHVPGPVANVVGDCEINDDVDDGYLPEPHLRPETFGWPVGLTAEEYLDLLDESDGNKPNCCGGGSGAGRPLDGELDAPEDGQSSGLGEAQAEALRDAVAADVREYMARHGRGSVPAGVAIWADERAAKIQIDWRRVLSAAVSRSLREITAGRQDYSWRKLSRRRRPVLRPGMVSYQPQIAIVADTSGSMSGFGAEVLGVVESILRRQRRAQVIQCDAAITVRRRGKPREWRGSGGTDLRPAIEQVCKDADLVVVVTDTDTPWPDDPPRRPVVVVTVGDARNVPPWVVDVVHVGGR